MKKFDQWIVESPTPVSGFPSIDGTKNEGELYLRHSLHTAIYKELAKNPILNVKVVDIIWKPKGKTQFQKTGIEAVSMKGQGKAVKFTIGSGAYDHNYYLFVKDVGVFPAVESHKDRKDNKAKFDEIEKLVPEEFQVFIRRHELSPPSLVQRIVEKEIHKMKEFLHKSNWNKLETVDQDMFEKILN
jgi:hypothetical protein